MNALRTVAALYVDALGVYPRLLGVDAWDSGPGPIVAHPDCGPWSKLRHLCTLQDPTCGPRAFEQVREFGGVLEHPEHSQLWAYMGLTGPGDATDSYNGRTYLVHQVDWGHCCSKPTWLYVVGVNQARVLRNIRARRGTGTHTHCISWDSARARRNGYELKRTSSATGRRTPPAFAAWLVELARASEAPRG